MPEVESIEALVSMRPKQRFGLRYALGCAVCGESHCGDDGIFGWLYGCGYGVCGVSLCGADDELSGIYQTGHWGGRTHIHRMSYYWPYNPQSLGQDAQRAKYAAGYAAWQALTEAQKAVYNQAAIGQHMSGYNLFMKKYLLS